MSKKPLRFQARNIVFNVYHKIMEEEGVNKTQSLILKPVSELTVASRRCNSPEMATRNRSRSLDLQSNPKLKLLERLIRNCFNKTLNHSIILYEDERYKNKSADEVVWCPRTFDGFACWDETPAGTTATQSCPEFVVGFDHKRQAFKTCTENGTWYHHPKANKAWTNYTTCVDYEDLDFRNTVNNIYVSGYSVSVAALVISLIIFFFFRSLRCTRIRVHMHLFTSFAINNILWIIWYKTVVTNPTVVEQNKVWCQILHVLTNYFMLTGYIWMFCEGLHLHIALVVVFVKDDVAMKWFCGLGWGLSFVIAMLYAVVRFFTPGATERCWMDQNETFWIINVPVVISLLASFVFLINVVRVLLTKLHPGPSQQTRAATAKAARAALILIPLFGLHFILIPLRPRPNEPIEKIYQLVSAVITSLQGLCVATLFCFTNHEVITATKAYLRKYFPQNEGIAMTGLTGGESMNTRDNVV